MSEQPKIIVENLESFTGGVNVNSYFNPFTKEIHVLEGNEAELRARIHENAHWDRRNKFTFRWGNLAALMMNPTIFLFSSAVILSICLPTLFLNYYVPSMVVIAFLYSVFICHFYEEVMANRAVKAYIRGLRKLKKASHA